MTSGRCSLRRLNFRATDPKTLHNSTAKSEAKRTGRPFFIVSIRSQALTRALQRKDPSTAEHAGRVERHSEAIARQLGLCELECLEVALAALLHDVGKIGVDDAVLLKPGPLSDREQTQMRAHAALGGSLVSDAAATDAAVLAVRHHHERWDGQGYPDGLAGLEIPLAARIIAVADSFDAMTSWRPYRRPVSVEEALAELRREAGFQFDPAVVQAFLQVQGAVRVQPPYGMV